MVDCLFCSSPGGLVLFNCDLYRILLAANEVDYPGLLRVVLNRHLKELSDLSDAEALTLYAAVLKCERIIRELYNPDKINIASLGNVTPHVHWHIIPRFKNDKHFPNPIWGSVNNLAYQPAAAVLGLTQELIEYFKTFST